ASGSRVMNGQHPQKLVIAVLPGDGIGPEVTAAAVRTLQALGLEAEYTEHNIGWAQWCERGEPLPQATIDAVRAADATLLGAITSKTEREAQAELAPELQGRGLRYRSPIVRLRQQLDLYACLRPARTPPGIDTPHDDVDLLVVRENTEGLYAGVEAYLGEVGPQTQQLAAFDAHFGSRFAGRGEVAATVRIISALACERIARFAFEQAARRGETHVVLADKPNVMRATGAVFVDAARRVADDFANIELVIENVDATAMLIAQSPQRYGVIVADNLFGDILSDVAAGVTGGPGLAASANIGPDAAVFEPVHGSAPDIAGTGSANPIACLRAAAMLAEQLQQPAIARAIDAGIDEVLSAGRVRTPDLGGNATTDQLTDAIIEAALAADPA
ncbi:MAG: isocitrate/isopropylmalate dehydrogenase family protein, partial [Planctomycetota bacterium]